MTASLSHSLEGAAADAAESLDLSPDAAPAPESVAERDAPATWSLRDAWAARRAYMERHAEIRMPDGRRHRRRWHEFNILISMFGRLLWALGLYQRGVRNALDLRLNRFSLEFADLPEAFDGYTILHLTDLHTDGLIAIEERLIALVDGIEVDACVLTGDYRFKIFGESGQAVPPLAALKRAVRTRDGAFAILGNHDSVDMVAPLEAAGYRVLANEWATLRRGGAEIHLIGTDDVHYYYTEQATHALTAAPEGFRIALVHSPELAEQAAEAGVSLYLSGHTHGGQICLPGGVPILTNSAARRATAHGVWRAGAMVGYTSSGVGISGLPVRYNSRGEAALITLRRGAGATANAPARKEAALSDA